MAKSVRRTVKKVLDGDTFQVARKIGGSNIVRLSGVDAPEKGSRGGSKATNVLRGMVGGKTVTIRPEGSSYGRVVGTVFSGGKSVNKKMRERGY
jgi:micrococcal nuclease